MDTAAVHTPPSSLPGDFLDEVAVSEIYGPAVATLRNWRALKKGPKYVKLGARSVRYRRADVEAWIAANTIDTEAAQ